MFSGPSGGCFVALLSEGHIFGGESADFHEQLAGGASLSAAIEQSAVASASSLRHTGRRADIDFSSLILPSVFPCSSIFSNPKRIFFL
jgi:hypothetical protein